MMREVPSHVDSDALERDVLAYWDLEQIFEKSLKQREGKDQFTFYDGPPYATGKPHYGHVLQSAIKDTMLRYKTMQGMYAPRRVGWDTHGLPIENIVEKELGTKTKRDIEADIAGFNERCRETVYRYVDEFRTTLKRIGRWADYGNEYSTLDRDYMESEWWVFKSIWDQGLIYKSFRSTPYCIRCATPLSNFEVGMAYKDVKDMSVYIALQSNPEQSRGVPGALRQAQGKLEAKLLIWTTTPWTLPANVAVAYNPELVYVVVKKDDQEYILAKDRVAHVLGDDAENVKEISIEELQSLSYEPLFASTLSEEEKSKSFKLVPSDHVTAQDGTGLVHMAPAFGEEDFNVAKKHNLPILRTVDSLGNYVADMPQWGGRNIFEAQKEVIKDLDTRGILFKRELITHSYPHCWRCDTPLIYMALDSWFLKVSELKERMLASNEHIHWIPEHVKHGRFEKGIESAPDWAISRNRFWSVPMPVWECDSCEERIVVGSVAELQRLSGATDAQVQDIHRPYVDDITWKHEGCSGTLKRIPEVLDVWFDSGSMPYAQWHYPFDNKEKVEAGYPADFIAESIEMTRAWFYVLHVLATGLTKQDVGLGKDKPAFHNAIASGLIFAEDGQKLSKKLKNYPEIEPVLEKYGADVLRFYLLSSTALGEPYKFSEKEMRQVQRNVYLTLWNVYSMFTRYALVHGYTPTYDGAISSNSLDQWIIARTNKLVSDVTDNSDTYRIDAAAREFITYIDDLSNWYVRRSRNRLQHPKSEVEKQEVFGTLYRVLVTVSKALAPFMPFVAEDMFRNLTGEESVHLVDYPIVDEINNAVLQQTKLVREMISQALAARAAAKIKVRQPLSRLMLPATAKDFSESDLAMIQEEVNVKRVIISDHDEMKLDITITDELKVEGIARDIIRHGQGLRKTAGFALDDRIALLFVTEKENLKHIFESQKEFIMNALQADTLSESVDDFEIQSAITLDGIAGTIGVKKV